MKTRNESPLVTIYIPTYNRVNLLKRAIQSVLAQTYKNIELIIVDDCSADDTLIYLESLVKQDDRVRFFQNEKNSGACVSRNKAIIEAKGEYITGLDDDDYFLDSRIEDFIGWIKTNEIKRENNICLFSDRIFLVDKALQPSKKPLMVSRKDLLVQDFFLGNQVFTKTISLKNNLFDPSFRMWQDFECWYRLLGDVGVAYNIKRPNYVVDVSHSYVRISHKKVGELIKTYNNFISKHKLNRVDVLILYSHVSGTIGGSYNFRKILLIFLFKEYKYAIYFLRKYVNRFKTYKVLKRILTWK